jgi:hypothetical protein
MYHVFACIYDIFILMYKHIFICIYYIQRMDILDNIMYVIVL